ncbi:MAG: PEGA domain-containing protein [Melioribacteraceae bacterium]
MKNKNYLLVLLFIIGIAFVSCNEDVTNPVESKGKIEVDSNPQGAEIWLDGTNTNEVTPATIDATEGLREVTLKLTGYTELTFKITVTGGETSIVNQNELQSLNTLNIQSDPTGAEIWFGAVNSGKVTPSSFFYADTTIEYTLKSTAYADSTVSVQLAGGENKTVSINLWANFLTSLSSTIWETTGTSASQPSGIDLSTGLAYGISSADKDKVDAYYSSDGFIVRSASDHSSMTRKTWFKVDDSKNLRDGINSPIKDGTWATSIADTVTKNVFLYDEDGNYSKFQIVKQLGGTPGDPSRVEIQWLYNDATGDTSF